MRTAYGLRAIGDEEATTAKSGRAKNSACADLEIGEKGLNPKKGWGDWLEFLRQAPFGFFRFANFVPKMSLLSGPPGSNFREIFSSFMFFVLLGCKE
jgi:hypothetical protein